jgi:hypothetical protein
MLAIRFASCVFVASPIAACAHKTYGGPENRAQACRQRAPFLAESVGNRLPRRRRCSSS